MKPRFLPLLASVLSMGAISTSITLVPITAHAQMRAMIEHIEPTAGPPGTQVTLVGRGFRNNVRVLFNEHEIPITTRSPERLTVTIPASASTGRFVVSQLNDEVESEVFRITASAPPPHVTAIEPTSAAAGAEVVIRGENFSPRLVDNQVTIGGRAMVVRNGDTTSLRVVVPDGASTGPINVRTPSGASDSPPLTVGTRVVVREFSPTATSPGGRITLQGTGFSATAAQNRVTLAGRSLRIVSATAETLVVEIPNDMQQGGTLQIDVSGAGRFETGASLRVAPAPVITRSEPTQAALGARVTLRGQRFGTSPSAVQAWLGETSATVMNVAPDALVVTVPQTAVTGRWRVSVGGIGPVSSPADFTVLQPVRIAGFAPNTGDVGDRITLRGAGFSTVIAQNIVKLGTIAATVVSATGSELVVQVPANARSGQWTVSVEGNGTPSTARDPFIVTLRPRITSVEPAMAGPGARVTLRGENFANDRSLVQVRLGDHDCQVESASRESLEVTLPNTLAPGAARFSVSVRLQGQSQAPSDFVVLVPTRILSVEPAAAPVGARVTVRGTGFETDPRRLRLRLGTLNIVPAAITTTSIEFVVPPRAQSGELTVEAPQREVARSAFVLQIPPVVQSLTPARARRTDRITLRGRNFGSDATAVSVTLNDVQCQIVSVTPTQIIITLPEGSANGKIKVNVRNQGEGISTGTLTIAP